MPAGEYGVDEGNVFDTFSSGTTFKNGRVTVRGDGRGATVIKLSKNIDTPTSNPIFNIRGEAYPIPGGCCWSLDRLPRRLAGDW